MCPAKAKPSNETCAIVLLDRETRGESLEGARAVLSVLENRQRYLGMTACEVATQDGQWSWYHKGFRWHVTKDMWTRYQDVRIMPRKIPRTVYYFKVGKGKVKWFGEYWGRIGRHVFFHKEK